MSLNKNNAFVVATVFAPQSGRGFASRRYAEDKGQSVAATINTTFPFPFLKGTGTISGGNKNSLFSLPIRLVRVGRASPLDKNGTVSSDLVTTNHKSLSNQEDLKSINYGLETQKNSEPMENKGSKTEGSSQVNSSTNEGPKVFQNISLESKKPPRRPEATESLNQRERADNESNRGSTRIPATETNNSLSSQGSNVGGLPLRLPLSLPFPLPLLSPIGPNTIWNTRSEPGKGRHSQTEFGNVSSYNSTLNTEKSAGPGTISPDLTKERGSFGARRPTPRWPGAAYEPPAVEGAGKKVNSGKSSLLRKQDQEVVSITYEEIGLFPRSFSRVLDRFLKQVFSDVEHLVIQEYRFYRYLFLTTLKCLLILFFVPFFVNFLAKTYIVRPLTEYFWNTKQSEIFLNSYQQKRAFSELKEFEEKTYFESLIFPKSVFTPTNLTIPFSLSENNENNNKNNNENNNEIKNEKNQEVEALSSQKTSLSKINNVPVNGLNPAFVREFGENQNDLTANSALFLNVGSTAGDSLATPSMVRGDHRAPSASQRQRGGDHRGGDLPNTLESSIYTVDAVIQSQPNLEEVKIAKENSKAGKVNTELLINSYSMKSSLFVYQTQEAGKNMQQRYQEKTIELAQRYNDQSIEAITNFFADLISLLTLFYLLYALEIQINITKSFLLEVFFGLDDSKKSLLILLITDLLVGYHSSNLWELFFEFLFHHYGLPESQTGIFLLVATLPVLLDVLFKYLIFRHLNRSSPATVATYHAMIE